MNDEGYSPGNETYTLCFKSPLLPPGIEIRTQTSGKYLGKTMNYMLQEIREFNSNLDRKGPLGIEEKIGDQTP